MRKCMERWFVYLGLIFLISNVEFCFAVQTVECWRMAEISLTSTREYTNAFDGVDITVTFTGPGKVELKRPAFWDGGKTWKIRFAPPTAGQWSYTTACNNMTDQGLNGQQGVITAVPYKGALPVYQHGFLKASDNRRYFVHADGTPFFYLGDTHWCVMHERFAAGNLTNCQSQFKYMVDKRVEQGFTVYQTQWMSPHYGTHVAKDEEAFHNWEDGISDADMPGFRNIDRKFQYLADKGMVVANAMNWRESILKFENGYIGKLARYWSARYGAYPVLWTMAQEVDGHMGGHEKWQVAAKSLSENDAYHHPLTAHMCGDTSASQSRWKDRPYHTWYGAQIREIPVNIAKDFWFSKPAKPSILYEPAYENFWTDEKGERVMAYVAFLSGFYGFGYGVAGVWDDNYAGPPNRDSGTSYDPNCTLWSDGLNRPSGDQMTHLKKFFTELEWWRLVPQFNDRKRGWLIKNARLACDEWRAYVAFFDGGRGTGTLLFNPNAKYTAKWYNPRTGIYTLISDNLVPEASGRWVIPSTPDTEDWVLLAKANDKTVAPPPVNLATISRKPLEGCWNFDDSMKDVSGNEHHGVLENGLYAPARVKKGLDLNGKDAFGCISSGIGLDEMNKLTVSIWVRPRVWPTDNMSPVAREKSFRMIIGSNGVWHAVVATENNPWYTEGTLAASSRTLTLGIWRHLVMTYDGSQVKVYQNGEPCGSGAKLISGSICGDDQIALGNRNSVNVQFMDGQLDELRIYNNALTPKQVMELFKSGEAVDIKLR